MTALMGRQDAQGTDTAVERAFAVVLGGVLKVETVPVDAHFFDDLGADSMVMAQFCARVRKRDDLPPVSIKDVYQHPTVRGLAGALAPSSTLPVEAAMAEVLAGVLKVETVPVDAHFFDDLGADSMVMAQFCARVRKRDDLPSVAIKDVYATPTIAGLATALGSPHRRPPPGRGSRRPPRRRTRPPRRSTSPAASRSC